MNVAAEKQAESFLLRLRKKDTPTGVSNLTIQNLIELTGLTKTEVAHLALRQMADCYIPRYEQDDGELTTEQINAIRHASSASNTPEENFHDRLF